MVTILGIMTVIAGSPMDLKFGQPAIMDGFNRMAVVHAFTEISEPLLQLPEITI